MIKVRWRTRVAPEDRKLRYVDEMLDGEILATFGPMGQECAGLFWRVREDRVRYCVIQHAEQEIAGQAQDNGKCPLWEEFRNGE